MIPLLHLKEGDFLDAQKHFKIHRICKGGMGQVFIVDGLEDHPMVAAKTFLPKFFRDEKTVARFRQESAVWTHLDPHPHVVQAVLCVELSQPFILLEYVCGGDLGDKIGSEELTGNLPMILELALQFCEGMIYLHSRGISVHRDIKPQNCLLTEEGALKITDFGLSKIFSGESLSTDHQPLDINRLALSQAGKAAGTCTHMAPEQFTDASSVTEMADVYSFGVMLFQMATGRLPFVAKNWKEMEKLHRSEPPPAHPSGNAELDSLITQCLQKQPAQRGGGFSELHIRLEAMLLKINKRPRRKWATPSASTAKNWTRKGHSHITLSNPAQALEFFDKALQLEPMDAGALIGKGVALRQLNRVTEALTCYDLVLQNDSDNVFAWMNKGVLLQTEKRPTEAIQCFDRVLQKEPDNHHALFGKINALKAMNKMEEALHELEVLVLRQPRNPIFLYSLGNTLGQMNQPDSAKKRYEEALDVNPYMAEAWNNLGHIHGTQGSPVLALECYRKCLEIDPLEPLALYNMGREYFALDQLPQSLDYYFQALKSNPRISAAWLNAGIIYARECEFKKALFCFKQAQHLGDSAADEALRRIYQFNDVSLPAGIQKQITPENDRDFTKLIHTITDLDPPMPDNNPIATAQEYYYKALEAQQKEDWETALLWHREAVKLDPRHIKAWLHQGLILGELRRLEEELACYDQVISMDPLFEDVCYLRGSTLIGLKRFPEALVSLDHALVKNPQDGQTFYMKGIACYGMQSDADALAWFERAEQAGVSRWQSYQFRGEILLETYGHAINAITAFEQAKKLGSPKADEWLAKCRQSLNQPISSGPQPPPLPGYTLNLLSESEAERIFNQGMEALRNQNYALALSCFQQSANSPAWSQDSLYNQGIVYGRMGQFDQEVAAYDKAIQFNPRHVQSFYNKGIALTDLKRFEEAEQSYRQALAVDPLHADSLYNHALLLLIQLGRASEALPVAERGTVQFPDQARFWYVKGCCLADSKNHESALQCLNKALQLNPNHEQSLLEKSVLLYGQKRDAEALTCVDLLLQLKPEKAQYWKTKGVILLDGFKSPTLAQPCFERASQLGHPEASQWLEKCRTFSAVSPVMPSPFPPALPPPQSGPATASSPSVLKEADEWFNKGYHALTAKNWTEALHCFDTVLRLVPTYHQAWFNKGIVHSSLNHLEEELACYDQAIRIKPDYEKALHSKGLVLIDLQRPDEARSCLESVLHINPQLEGALLELGILLVRKSKCDEALVYLDRALSINPNLERGWYHKGVCHQAQKKWQETVDAFNRATDLNPDYKDALYGKGYALYQLQRDREALNLFRKVTSMDPLHDNAWFMSGLALMFLKQGPESIEAFKRTLDLKPADQQAWLSMGKVWLELQQDPHQARSCFEQARKLGHPDADEWIAKCI